MNTMVEKDTNSKLPAIALWLFAVAIALPGVVGLLSPVTFLGHGLSIDGLDEARGLAGTRIGFAIVLAVAAVRAEWRRAGLLAGCVVFGCTLLGRVLSNALDGMPPVMIKPEILEVVLLVIALVATRALPRRSS